MDDLLTEPVPTGRATEVFAYPVVRRLSRRAESATSTLRFSEVLEGRRSERVMSAPRFRDVVDLISLATRARFEIGPPRGGRSLTPVISAGGLQAIQPFLVPMGGRTRVFRYNRIKDALEELAVLDEASAVAFRHKVSACLPDGRGLPIVLLADRMKARAAYDAPESLLWRDSGALLQTIAMVAWAEGHAFCPLGIHGAEIAVAIGAEAQLMPVGVAVLGRR